MSCQCWFFILFIFITLVHFRLTSMNDFFKYIFLLDFAEGKRISLENKVNARQSIELGRSSISWRISSFALPMRKRKRVQVAFMEKVFGMNAKIIATHACIRQFPPSYESSKWWEKWNRKRLLLICEKFVCSSYFSFFTNTCRNRWVAEAGVWKWSFGNFVQNE